MRGPSPAVEPLFVCLCAARNPFGDKKLHRAPTWGMDGPCGPLVCDPMPAHKKLMDYLARVKTGADGYAM